MDKPNIVLCLCDQLRVFEVGALGNSYVRTPALDRLISAGTCFSQGVTNNPVCMPARLSLLTGQYSRTAGVNIGNNFDENHFFLYDPQTRRDAPGGFLPEMLKKHGYDTAVIGKWHLPCDPCSAGFDYSFFPAVYHRYTGQAFHRNRGPAQTDDRFQPVVEQEELGKYLDSVGENPFFLYYNISLPHMPLLQTMPETYTAMDAPDQIPIRENAYTNGKLSEDPFWFRTYTYWDYILRHMQCDINDDYPLPDDFDLKSLTALYYGAVAAMDDQLSALERSLEVRGLTENTIVIFLSDHGDNLGSHGRFNKDCLYEESIRIPIVFRWTNHFVTSINHTHQAQIIDVLPTILDTINIDVPKHIQGRSLMPILKGECDELPDNYAFIETSLYEIGIRTPQFKVGMLLDRDTRQVANENYQLFCIEEDPYENNNLVGTSSHSEAFKRLKEKLLLWNDNTPWL